MEFKTRQSERKDTLNLVDYVVLSTSGQPLDRGMARTLNISEKGILLETHLPFEKGQELILTIGLKNNLFEYKGKIAHAEKQDNDAFAYGVEFIEMRDDGLTILREFLKTFNEKRS